MSESILVNLFNLDGAEKRQPNVSNSILANILNEIRKSERSSIVGQQLPLNLPRSLAMAYDVCAKEH